jgi:hypothetical protein
MASKPTIQRGSKAFGTATSITIVRGTDSGFDTTVDATKSILLWSLRTTNTGTASSNRVRATLTDGDTITFTRIGTGTVVTVEWQLLSFATGVTVQHRTATIPADGTSTAATASIDAAGSGGRFIIPGGATATGIPDPTTWGVRWLFASGTSIEASRHAASASIETVAACQVVEWDDATVQTVDIAATWAATTRDESISTVDASKTLVFGSSRISSNAAQDLAQTFSFPNSTTLRLTRNGSTSRTFAATVYVVSIASGVGVQYIDATIANAATTGDGTASAVTVADTALHVANLQNNWPLGRAVASNLDRSLATPELTSTTNLRMTRGVATDDVGFTTQVIEFQSAAPPPPSGHIRLLFRAP